jgi:hypothetical protein
VLNDGGHPAGEQAYFKIRMYNGSDSIACASFDVDATTAYTIGGYTALNTPIYGPVLYKPWSTVVTPLSSYIGQTVTLTFTISSCNPSGCSGTHFAYAYVSAECSAQGLTVKEGGCSNSTDTLVAPVGFATYTWTGPGITSGDTTSTITVDQAGQYMVNLTTYGNVPCVFSMDTNVQICTGITQPDNADISIYPNPAKSDFVIEISRAITNGQIEIYDVLGQRLFNKEIKQASGTFKLPMHLRLEAGVYLVVVSDGERFYTRKMVVEN